MYPDPVKLNRQLKYANTLGIPFVVVCGPEEAEGNVVTVRNMASGEQRVVACSELAAFIQERIGKAFEKGIIMYYRIHVHYSSPTTGKPVGVFAAMHHLKHAGRLTPEEEALYAEIDGWFKAHLPEPPFYQDGNSIGAVTWFKTTGREMMTRLDPLVAILAKYGNQVNIATSHAPGAIVYEDDFQVGVVELS